MRLKERLTRALMAGLPLNEQQTMVRDFVDWLYADLPSPERREKAGRLEPRVIEWICEGKMGLWLLLCQHFRRLSPGRLIGLRTRGPQMGPGQLTRETTVDRLVS
jgi:hypothetical protein